VGATTLSLAAFGIMTFSINDSQQNNAQYESNVALRIRTLSLKLLRITIKSEALSIISLRKTRLSITIKTVPLNISTLGLMLPSTAA